MNKIRYVTNDHWGDINLDNTFDSLEILKKDIMQNKEDYVDDDNGEVIIYEVRPVKKIKIITGFEEVDISKVKVVKKKK